MRLRFGRRSIAAACLAGLLGGCCGVMPAPVDGAASKGLVNVGDARAAATHYHDSGAYDRDLVRVADAARRWVEKRAGQVSHPALVLDVDETSLSNWPVMKADDFAYIRSGACDSLPAGPCGYLAWENRAEAVVLPGTLTLVRAAQSRGVAIFFVTGRGEAERAATAANLTHAGYRDWTGLYLRAPGRPTPSAADYKAPIRAVIEARGYTIIANMGDQPSDLAGGHAERTFLLPNPFYRIN
ncbi:HAD family acid phosphatase [Gluconacetobacter tumulisoli]|uniref:Acid phosphatase n=1 Tax=Gluconacetobacter tumulisoli TaxID=1286189 RepID=A0A7W4K7J3_9PROT|nr:HAD family acid phosphatase [Gluconacetobacter tumulisoli]MBB2201766.1 acid phosphatase [Gluconacetobacter tumulisoli]